MSCSQFVPALKIGYLYTYWAPLVNRKILLTRSLGVLMSVKGSCTLHKPAAGKLQWSNNIIEVKCLFESCCLTALPSTCLLCLCPMRSFMLTSWCQCVVLCSACWSLGSLKKTTSKKGFSYWRNLLGHIGHFCVKYFSIYCYLAICVFRLGQNCEHKFFSFLLYQF